MDELFARGVQPVPEVVVAGQAAGLSGLLAVLTVTLSVLVSGAIVAGGAVLLVGAMLVIIATF
jgi:hypothetical protein